MALPELTPEQRAANLAKANKLRAARKDLKRDVKQGWVKFSQALDKPEAQRIPVKQLIESVPNIGERKAELVMAMVGINYRRRVQGLGPRQREKLIDILG